MPKFAKKHFKKTAHPPKDDIAIDSDMLYILAAIEQNKSLREVYHEVEMDSASFKKAFTKLYDLNLVERVKKKTLYLGKKKLSQIKGTLGRLCGPAAELLFQEALQDKGFEEDRIPKDRHIDLIISIARQIPAQKQKLEFEKIMIHGR